MLKQVLKKQILQKRSFLCVGLDTDLEKIPEHLLAYEDPIFEFNKRIIDATQDLCVAYKPNIAFYEPYGAKGWDSLKKTFDHFPSDIFSIADAKRGDIGNTAKRYAEAFFNPKMAGLDFDSVTVAPYMGKDSIQPFMEFEGKWAIVLALTSNDGSQDFQMQKLNSGEFLFEKVLKEINNWGSDENTMYVVGATRGEYFKKVRETSPKHFLLVPGVGAQGGDLKEVCEYALNQDVGLLINATRSIIYASSGKDFAEKAREEALKLQQEMDDLLSLYESRIENI